MDETKVHNLMAHDQDRDGLLDGCQSPPHTGVFHPADYQSDGEYLVLFVGWEAWYVFRLPLSLFLMIIVVRADIS
jgi:hypothetical protein